MVSCSFILASANLQKAQIYINLITSMHISSQGKNTEVVCHSLLQWTTFCQISPPWPACLGWPHRAWLSFIELDKAVVLVWLDWLVFCDYGFSVSALWCPLATPTVLLGFLLPWTWGIFSQLLQQSTATAPAKCSHCSLPYARNLCITQITTIFPYVSF